MMKSIVVFSLIAAIIWLGCVEEQAAKQSINPNGDSELALLMREMYDDGMRTKQALLDGKDPVVTVSYQEMYTAHATEPEKVARPEYAQYAKHYEESVLAFLTSDPEVRAANYQTMVATCMSCHQAMCPGPMVKIRKMYLSEKEIARFLQ
jgi:hypothetical protein